MTHPASLTQNYRQARHFNIGQVVDLAMIQSPEHVLRAVAVDAQIPLAATNYSAAVMRCRNLDSWTLASCGMCETKTSIVVCCLKRLKRSKLS